MSSLTWLLIYDESIFRQAFQRAKNTSHEFDSPGDTLCPCGNKQLSIEPIEAMTEPGACTARRERLYRRRPPKCINYHPEEMEIKICGGASTQFSRSTLAVLLLTIFVVSYDQLIANRSKSLGVELASRSDDKLLIALANKLSSPVK
ncbi:LOW QUALITY PROTEIN: voltage-dependent calcium channel subunit alpha-2/delta-4 isoform X1 [Vespula squamosa]|uniref:Voltage-dependent calcium channel subunit alpha-2/delta-4 isoform X1 n=1 Tax=Vespula squamosa TaxID=30214 RepID=A0ABD2B8D1_VESSQ